MKTLNTSFSLKKENHRKLSQICSYGLLLQGSQERVRNSQGKRAISVRAIEFLLFLATVIKSDNSISIIF